MSLDNPYTFEIVKTNQDRYDTFIDLPDGCEMNINYSLVNRRDERVDRNHKRQWKVRSWGIIWTIREPGHVLDSKDRWDGHRMEYENRRFDNSVRIMSTLYHATTEFRDLVNPKHVHCTVEYDGGKESLARINRIMLLRAFPESHYTHTTELKSNETSLYVRRN